MLVPKSSFPSAHLQCFRSLFDMKNDEGTRIGQSSQNMYLFNLIITVYHRLKWKHIQLPAIQEISTRDYYPTKKPKGHLRQYK